MCGIEVTHASSGGHYNTSFLNDSFDSSDATFDSVLQETMMKMVIEREEWEEEMNVACIVKRYMDRIVMDYLVAEGNLEAAQSFMDESLTKCND